MRILFIAVLSVLVFANCQTTKNEKTDSIVEENPAVKEGWDTIMAVHDEIMPISMKLPPMWEALDSLASTVDEATATEIIETVITLKKVHKDMYDWMGDANLIRVKLEKAKEEALSAIIAEETDRITQIKEETNTIYEIAQKLLSTEE